MQDLPERLFFQRLTANSVSPERLEGYGKHAAALYRRGEASLTDAVVETVKDAALSPEQVQRVVEFANQTAFLQEFKEAEGDKYIDFPQGPANTGDVLRDLNDGGSDRGHPPDRGVSDYSRLPDVKTSALSEEVFYRALTSSEKTAGIEYAEPLQPLMEVWDCATAAEKAAASELWQAESAFEAAAATFYENVKQAAMMGTSLGDIVQALQHVPAHEGHVKNAFAMVTPLLLKDEVFRTPNDLIASFQKLSSARAVNTGHPLLASYAAMNLFAEKIATARQTRAECAEKVAGIVDAIKGFGRKAQKAAPAAQQAAEQAAPAAAKATGGGGIAGFFRRGGQHVEAGAKKVIEAFGGPEAANSAVGGALASTAGGLVRYAPHLAGAAALYNLHQGAQTMRANPSVANALSYVPFTTENQVAHELAMNGGYGGY